MSADLIFQFLGEQWILVAALATTLTMLVLHETRKAGPALSINEAVQLVNSEGGVFLAHRLLDERVPVVERDPQIAAVLANRGPQVFQVGRHDRVGGVVREVPVRLEVELDRLDLLQTRKQLFDRRARDSVPAIDRDLQGSDPGLCDLQDVIQVGLAQVLAHRATAIREGGGVVPTAGRFDLFQPRQAAHRPHAFTANLEAVVTRWVVARGDHHAAL